MVTQKYIPTRGKILFGPQEMNTGTILSRKSKFYINFDLSHFSMAEIFFVSLILLLLTDVHMSIVVHVFGKLIFNFQNCIRTKIVDVSFA